MHVGTMIWLFSGCLAVALPAQAQKKDVCTTDADCSDHVYCNGVERCEGSYAQARCVAAPVATPCMAGQTCDEAGQRCLTPRTDADGDGHNSQVTGGDDCDDNNVNRFPGNAETWDASDADDDCLPMTHGVPPAFGAVPANASRQACSGENVVTLARSEGSDVFTSTPCGTGMACGGPGVCVAKDANYVAPPVFFVPSGPQVNQSAPQQTASSLAPQRAKLTVPMAMPVQTASPVRPAATAPVSAPTAKSKLACPAGQEFNATVGKCIPIPPK